MPRPSHRTFVSILMEQRQQAQHTAGRLKLSLVQTGSNMAESPSPPLLILQGIRANTGRVLVTSPSY